MEVVGLECWRGAALKWRVVNHYISRYTVDGISFVSSSAEPQLNALIPEKMISLSLIVGVCLVLYIFWVYIITPIFLSPLAKIPNAHFSSSFNPFWILWKRYREQENRTIHAAHEKHGKIVRLGPNEISIDSVDDGIRIVYSGGFEKGSWYPNQFDNYE